MVPSSGSPNARIMIVGEAPGEHEVRLGRPFVGPSGDCLDQMLHEVGLMRSACFVCNVARERPLNNNIELWVPKAKSKVTPEMVPMRDKMVHPIVEEGWRLLQQEIDLVSPTVILALGNVSLWALTGKWGIKSWRGSSLFTEGMSLSKSYPVIPMYHPAYILRDWSSRAISLQDLRRAAVLLGIKSDSTLVPLSVDTVVDNGPNYRLIVRPDYGQVQTYLHALHARLQESSVTISCDIETVAGHIECIGLATSASEAICIPLMAKSSPGYWSESEEEEIIRWLKLVLTHPQARVIGQNFIYDSQYIYRHWGFVPNFARDTMLSHHTQFAGLPKSLEFLSSMYCKEHVAWKWAAKDRSFKKDA